AEQYKISVSGISNTAFCSNCTQLNADYTVTFASGGLTCTWNYTIIPSPCGVTAISLKIMQNADRTVKLTVDLPGVATWEKDNVHGCLNRSLELPKISSSSLCSAANPVTVTPVYFSDSDLLPKGACVTNAA